MNNESTLNSFELVAGMPPEYYDNLIDSLEKIGLLINNIIEIWSHLCQPMSDTLADLDKILKGVYYIPKAKIPKTPYSFRTKARTIFKRLKIYHIRSNCRKER